MNQRFDLFAFALLLFSVLLTIWLVALPISLDGIWRWQTLISGVATFLGIVVASWNVTRQMRLAARGREQDRIERELPGLREAGYLMSRFYIAFGKKAEPSQVLEEFKALELDQAKIADFLAKVIQALPLTPDVVKREVALDLFRLQGATRRAVDAEEELRLAKGALARAERTTGQDASEARTLLAGAELALETGRQEFDEVITGILDHRQRLIERIKRERKRGEILRRELERSLALRE